MSKQHPGFCRFEREGVAQWGVLKSDAVYALGDNGEAQVLEALRDPETTLGLIELALKGEPCDSATLKLLPPILPEAKVLCVGLNYKDHVAETGRETPKYPVIFSRFPETFVGHGQALIRPPESREFDYEGELAVIIGMAGRRIDQEDAHCHIAGYSLGNDATIRDWQFHTHQYLPGKNFADSGSLGPAIYPEPGDISDQVLSTHIGADCLQEDRLNNMLFSISQLIAYCSTFLTLQTGDIILTGTPSGVGFKKAPKRFLVPGDTVSISVEGLATLSNSVEDEPTSTN